MASGWVEAEFEAIFRENYERILRVVRRVLRCDAEAEEVCAEVFLRLYRGGSVIAEGGLVRGWLYRTATRAAIDALRAQQRRGKEEELDGDRLATGASDEEGPLTRLLRGEQIAEVRSVLAQLNVSRAQLLLLRHAGLSYQEIAAAMQMNVTSVGTMLARAEAEFSSKLEHSQQQSKKNPVWKPAKERQ